VSDGSIQIAAPGSKKTEHGIGPMLEIDIVGVRIDEFPGGRAARKMLVGLLPKGIAVQGQVQLVAELGMDIVRQPP